MQNDENQRVRERDRGQRKENKKVAKERSKKEQ